MQQKAYPYISRIATSLTWLKRLAREVAALSGGAERGADFYADVSTRVMKGLQRRPAALVADAPNPDAEIFFSSQDQSPSEAHPLVVVQRLASLERLSRASAPRCRTANAVSAQKADNFAGCYLESNTLEYVALAVIGVEIGNPGRLGERGDWCELGSEYQLAMMRP
jgi:hypothetical protein